MKKYFFFIFVSAVACLVFGLALPAVGEDDPIKEYTNCASEKFTWNKYYGSESDFYSVKVGNELPPLDLSVDKPEEGPANWWYVKFELGEPYNSDTNKQFYVINQEKAHWTQGVEGEEDYKSGDDYNGEASLTIKTKTDTNMLVPSPTVFAVPIKAIQDLTAVFKDYNQSTECVNTETKNLYLKILVNCSLLDKKECSQFSDDCELAGDKCQDKTADVPKQVVKCTNKLEWVQGTTPISMPAEGNTKLVVKFGENKIVEFPFGLSGHGSNDVVITCSDCSDKGVGFKADNAKATAVLTLDITTGAHKSGAFPVHVKAAVQPVAGDTWTECIKEDDVYFKVEKKDCSLMVAGMSCLEEKNSGSCKTACGVNGDCKFFGGQCKNISDITTADLAALTTESLKEKYPDPREDGWQGAMPTCAFSGTCRDVNKLVELIVNFGAGMFAIMGSFAFAFFVYGGFTMIVSMGNAEKQKKGQQILVAAVIGLVIAFSAFTLIKFMLDAVGVAPEFRPTELQN